MRFITALFLFFSIFLSHIYAQAPVESERESYFDTAYDVTYQVHENGVTRVLFKVSLTNKSDEYYASSYTLGITNKDIENLKANDSDGPLSVLIKQENERQDVTISFDKRISGIGKTLVFTVAYDTKDIAKKHGNIWEINIPGIANQQDFTDFSSHVVVPSSFGEPSYIKPDTGKKSLDFSKEDLGKGGISISFGDKQYYSISLTYHLKNANLFPVKTELALPPETNYQQISIDSIEPKPLNVIADEDGNWLAQYLLLPGEQKEVYVKGLATVFLRPKKELLSPSEYSKYTKPLQHWESTDPKIVDLAKKHKTPKEIFDYVVQVLTYDYSRVTSNQKRLGAKNVLESPSSAVCLEFTDLFIAISRAAGIPAREIDGFAYTTNTQDRPLSLVKDVLHAWPEYYDERAQTWIMVDPTWQNTTKGVDYFTTLDFDHIAFVRKGIESEYPIPAGGYKTNGLENVQDVHVSLTDPVVQDSPIAKLSVSLPEDVVSGFMLNGEVQIENTGKVVFPSSQLMVNTILQNPPNTKLAVNNIPPYGWTKVPLAFSTGSFLTKKQTEIKIQLQNEIIQQSVLLVPIFETPVGIGGGIVFVLSAVSVFIIARKARRLSVSG